MDEIQMLPVPTEARELQRYVDQAQRDIARVFALPPRLLKRYPKPILVVSNPK